MITVRASSSILTLGEMLRAQGRVFHALMLRDIRTRFFGSAWGFLISIGWPLAHLLAIVLMNAGLGRAAPYGDSAALFFATGSVPYICFLYVARFIMMGMLVNRPLLAFPAVKITDIMFARAIIEMLSAGVVIILLCIGLWAAGITFMPRDAVQAASAVGASMLLGVGVGMLNGMIVAAMPQWFTVFSLFAILIWIGSGIVFIVDTMPPKVRFFLSYNPVLQGVEWMRSAYYEGYGASVLDKSYMVSFGLISLALGLGIERLFRGRLLQ